MIKSLTLMLTMAAVLGLSPILSYGTNESSYQYGYWQGSLTGPTFEKGANWNPILNCNISPSFISDNPKGVVIPAVTNTTACEAGFFGYFSALIILSAIMI
jgi:hypothetical protein